MAKVCIHEKFFTVRRTILVLGVEPWLKNLSEGEFNEKNWKLTHAAVLCEKMRAAVFEKTGFRCSAGISANKMLAKLACGKYDVILLLRFLLIFIST